MSIHRNLQHELITEFILLAFEDDGGSSPQSARTQAAFRLQKLLTKIRGVTLDAKRQNIDDYTQAHLIRSAKRIEKALDAAYTRNGSGGGGNGGGFLIFGRESQ